VPGWYLVALNFTEFRQRVWMEAGPAFEFIAADSRQAREEIADEVWHQTLNVDLRDTRHVDGMLWWRIDLHSRAPCGDGPGHVLASGWLPAYTRANDLTMWHYSRQTNS
jgi:hypothetical protein